MSEAKLRSLLDADAGTGLKAVKDGKISRSHYAARLGMARTSLSLFSHVFKEYEEKLALATGPMRHLAAMKVWLSTGYQNRTLKITHGKIDRIDFCKHFKLRGSAFITRYPEIRELFAEFERRAKDENYIPALKSPGLDALTVALSGTPVLNSDRLSINKPMLARELSLPIGLFDDPLFATAIKAKEDDIRAAAIVSKINPYFHDRVYAFSDLTGLWDSTFLEKIGVFFKQHLSGKSKGTVKGNYHQFLKLLRWIGASENEHCRRLVSESAKYLQIRSSDDWEDAIHQYRSQLTSTRVANRSDSGIDNDIKSLRPVLEMLNLAGLAPQLPTRLRGIKFARRRATHLRSVAEVVGNKDPNQDPYAEFVRIQLNDACKKIGIQEDSIEAGAFIDSISLDITSSPKSTSELSIAIRDALHKRMLALKTSALAILEEAMTSYNHGKELLSIAQINSAEFEREYLASHVNKYRRRIVMRSCFPDGEVVGAEQSQLGLANLLSLVEQRCGGIPPVKNNLPDIRYGQFFQKRYLAYGGVDAVSRLLNPSPNVVGAVLTLYLIDSGANITVGRTLDRDCLESSKLPHHSRITGSKSRAQGKPIIVDLPDESPAVRAIRWLQSVRNRLESAATIDADRLFLMRVGQRVQLMTPHWYTNWFKEFSSSVPGLERLLLTPNMIRPSVLLEASLSNDGRLATGMAIGQHTTGVSAGYQVKFPTRLLYDEAIRRFQDAFQTLVMSSLTEAAEMLGISEVDFSARLEHLRPTGLGTYCKDHRGRPGQQNSAGCQTADCWNDCPNLLIVAEVEAITTLQIWRASLREAQPEWERDRPERWDEVWLPWLCLTEVVAEKMARGPLIKIWNAATVRVKQMSSQVGFSPPKPW